MKNTSSSKLSTVDPSDIKKANPVTKIVRIVVLGLSFVATVMSPTMAETFSIDGNKALNTNNNFVKVDGNPRMSIWDFNPNDADQQFDRLQGMSGSTLLRHRSTGKCLNAYYLKNGGVISTWPCNAGDPAQNFNIISVGNGYSLIQRRGTNFCVDSPTRNNGGMVHLWNCNSGIANQRWQNGSTNPTPQPPTPSTQRNSQRKVNDFVNQWNGKTGIDRYDERASYWGRFNSRGQCVTLIARYLQDHYGASRTSLGIGNGGQTAATVGSNFSGSFLPLSDPSDPIPGSILSFPNSPGSGNCNGRLCGHVALVVTSQRDGNQLKIKILESNYGLNNIGVNSRVQLSDITVNTQNYTVPGRGNVQWVNPRD